MGKFDGILICTDLDGTLYKNDKKISEETKEAIEYFSEHVIFSKICGVKSTHLDTDIIELLINILH